jgi:hypothetical protein
MSQPVENRSGLERELKVLLALAIGFAVSGFSLLALVPSDSSTVLSAVATLALITSLLLAGGITPLAVHRMFISAGARTIGSMVLTILASFILFVALGSVVMWYWG